MRTGIFITALYACSTIFTTQAKTPDLIGAWKGPMDLMINLCESGDSQPYVCSCGIFRTFGWADVTSIVTGDSLLLKANDAGSPLEGRFRIESENRLTGSLSMGEPGEEWYFNGSAELVRQKPALPENINQDLEGIIHTSDYNVLSLDRELAWKVLSTVSPRSYGYAEKQMVERLLNAKALPVSPKDMLSFRHVRSIQIDERDGIFSYPYFKCRFKETDGKVFFEKTTGSQRKSGYVYQNSPESLIFLGGWSVNDDPQTAYGSVNSVVGTIYKIAPDKAVMIFPTENNRVEIYELK